MGTPPRRIVAAADGIVRYIVDEFDARQDRTARQCYNNYVWLEHSNGEWTKYSHMRQHSVRHKANLREGNTVGAGTYLGDEGDVGCATGPHLHFEVAVPYNRDDPITPTGGFIKGRNLVPRICGVPDETLIAGTVHLGAQCGSVGAPNVADMSRWAASYDSTAKTRFIPIELWTGGEWDGTHEVRMTPANLSFGRRGEKRITGPLAWTRPGTAEPIQVYERSNKGKRQLFALSSRGDGLGRVFDSRYGRNCVDEIKFPLGLWKDGETRVFDVSCNNGTLRRKIELTIEKIDFVYDGAPHSLQFHWVLDGGKGPGTDMRYIYCPGRGLASLDDDG